MLGEAELGRLRAILHQPPRAFGHPRSTWTLALLAEVAHAEGLSPTEPSGKTRGSPCSASEGNEVPPGRRRR